MHLIKLTQIKKRLGNRELFTGIDLNIKSKDKLGLIGPNGSGKSTLLKIIAEIVDSDNGEIDSKPNLKVSYLAQSEEFDIDSTLIETVVNSMANDIPEEDKKAKALVALSRMGFSDNFETTKISEISGGWRKRLAIACAIAQDADLILLDEPTNHLDLEGIMDLENSLKNADFAFILVSHDRRFLNNVTNKTIEINPIYKKGFYKLDIPYEKFIQKKEEFFKNEQDSRNSLKARLKIEQEWLQRGAKARTTKQEARIGSIREMQSELKDLNKRLSMKRSQERTFAFSPTDRKTKRLIELKNISKSYGDKTVIRDFSLTLSPKMCLGLLGENGAGKSTLQNIISKKLEPTKGRVKYVDNLKIAVFDQARTAVNKKLTPRELFCRDSDSVVFHDRLIHINAWLKYLNLRHDQADTFIKNLSGGEQARLNLGLIMLQKADILLLDEPTNDLDIESLRMLEEALKTFTGAIVLISHDRKLVESVSTKILGFVKGGMLQEFEDIEQWQNFIKNNEITKIKSKVKEDKPKQDYRNRDNKISFKDKYEYENIESDISKLEAELKELQKNPVSADNFKEFQNYCDELNRIQKEIENKYSRWEELETLFSE